MSDRQKIGGIAAIIEAATFIFGFILFATMLSDYTIGDPEPGESVAFLVDHQTAFYVWHVVILIVFGIALVPLVLALHDRLKADAPGIAQTATAFGVIWSGLVIASGMIANIGIGTVADLHETDPARAEPVWSALDSVQNGLGGGNEIVGGIWVLLISWAALQTQRLPAALNYLGIVAGLAGIVTVIPALEVVGAVFGLGLIVWFIWIGIVLVRSEERAVSRSSFAPAAGQ
jgi:hypothetical protein